MNLLEADAKLRQIEQPCLRTRDVAAYLGISTVYASNVLRRLAGANRIIRLGRGRWLINEISDRYAIPEYLTSPWPAYISLHTALHHHGLISQIPSVVYAVSLARTARYKNPAGEFSIHHINPTFFFGYELTGKFRVKIAVPEKALLDYLYLFPARSRLFRSLPEIEFPRSFKVKVVYAMIEKIPSRAKQSLVRTHFDRIYRAIVG